MNIHSCCLTCLLGQIERAYKKLKPKSPNEEIVRVQKKAMENLSQLKQTAMPYYSQVLYHTLNQEMGVEDPYHQIKKIYNEKALNLVPQLHRKIEESDQPLQTAISIAIMGNTVDFGTPHQIDLEADVSNFHINQLEINHFTSLEKTLLSADTVLIIADNCGECVFDMILLEYLSLQYPKKNLYYAVRSGPVINDCTKADVAELNLDRYCTVIESSASPGVIIQQATKKFQSIFNTADLILSKGQGNFEALDNIEPPHGRLYFLLKAKCEFVASLLEVSLGALILCDQKAILQKY